MKFLIIPMVAVYVLAIFAQARGYLASVNQVNPETDQRAHKQGYMAPQNNA
jgi:hypothetical protein